MIVHVLIARHGQAAGAEEQSIREPAAGAPFGRGHIDYCPEGDAAGAIGWIIDYGPAACFDPGIEEGFELRNCVTHFQQARDDQGQAGAAGIGSRGIGEFLHIGHYVGKEIFAADLGVGLGIMTVEIDGDDVGEIFVHAGQERMDVGCQIRLQVNAAGAGRTCGAQNIDQAWVQEWIAIAGERQEEIVREMLF